MRFLTRHWLLVLAALSLGSVLLSGNQPIHGMHTWRQADTISIGRAFDRGGFDLLYPRVSWATPGFVGTEPPLASLIVGLVRRLTGGEPLLLLRFLFRLASTLGLVLFAKLVQEIAGMRIAVFASVCFLVSPIFLYFGNAIMPEPLLIGASMALLFSFHRWTRQPGPRWLAAAVASALLCFAIKLPSLHLLPLLAFLAYRSGRRFYSPKLLAALFLSAAPAVAWTLHAFSVGRQNPPYHVFGEGLYFQGAILFNPRIYPDLWHNFLPDTTNWPGLILMALGLYACRKPFPGRGFCLVWLTVAAGYFLAAIAGCQQHNYYFVPVLGPLSLLAGVGAAHLCGPALAWPPAGRALARWGLAVMLVAGLGFQGIHRTVYGMYVESEIMSVLREAATAADRVIPESQRLVLVSEYPRSISRPEFFYYADKRGWKLPFQQLTPDLFKQMKANGYHYFVLIAHDPSSLPRTPTMHWLLSKAALVSQGPHHLIFRLPLEEPSAP